MGKRKQNPFPKGDLQKRREKNLRKKFPPHMSPRFPFPFGDARYVDTSVPGKKPPKSAPYVKPKKSVSKNFYRRSLVDVKVAINNRRAYRSLEPVHISEVMIKDLAEHARLSPSCFNKQPWRFVFITDPDILKLMDKAMSTGNQWTRLSSMIVAVFSERELDCLLGERQYFLFDSGMATAFMILRATEMGLVAHPIAGYDEKKTKEILNIPENMRLITLVCVGKKSENINPLLNKKLVEIEKKRPPRHPFETFASINKYKPD
jgi:nitroreductase